MTPRARPLPDPLLTSPYRLVLPRGSMPRGLSTHATYTHRLSVLLNRTRGVAPIAIAPVYYNGSITNSGAHDEIPGLNNVYVRSACERLGATNVVKKWKFGGIDVGVMAPGQLLIGDFMTGEDWTGVPGSTWPVNAFLAVRTEASVASPSHAIPAEPANHMTSTANTGGVTGTRSDQSFGCTSAQAGDQVYATGPLVTTGGSTSTSCLVPFAFIGLYAEGASRLPAVVAICDSIGDDAYANAFNYFGAGGTFIDKALRTRQFPYTKVAMGSRSAIGWNGNNPATLALMAWMDYLILQEGVNGLAVKNPSGEKLYEIAQSRAYAARLRGTAKIVGLTLTPTTTTSNSLIDAAGQSYRTGYGPGQDRDIYNGLLLAGVGSTGPGVDILVDTAAAIQDPTDGNKILTNGTPFAFMANNDAPAVIHPNEAGHDLMDNPLAASMSSWTLA